LVHGACDTQLWCKIREMVTWSMLLWHYAVYRG